MFTVPEYTAEEREAYAAARNVPVSRVPKQIAAKYPGAVAILKKQLFFAPRVEETPRFSQDDGIYAFTTDGLFKYEPYTDDFGPLNLAQVYRYCEFLSAVLSEPRLASYKIVHFSGKQLGQAENAAFLLGAYSIIIRGLTPKEAIIPFTRLTHNLVPFRDASYAPESSYDLRLMTCLQGLYRAVKLGWYDPKTFDVDSYEKYEKVLWGDLNWIIPGKFIAFSGPMEPSPYSALKPINTPQKYIPIFRTLGVKLIIRLNKKQYRRKIFTNAGFKHLNLYFLDGSCPSEQVVKKFLKHCEAEEGAIAVHCKAGLGRTGTLIGCYAMKHYNFQPGEWIAWNRICRPGSVLGPQQHFLHVVHTIGWLKEPTSQTSNDQDKNKTYTREAIASQGTSATRDSSFSLTTTHAISDGEPYTVSAANWLKGQMMPENQLQVAEHGEKGQGERLLYTRQKLKIRNSTNLLSGRGGPAGLVTACMEHDSGGGEDSKCVDFNRDAGAGGLTIPLKGHRSPVKAAAAWSESSSGGTPYTQVETPTGHNEDGADHDHDDSTNSSSIDYYYGNQREYCTTRRIISQRAVPELCKPISESDDAV